LRFAHPEISEGRRPSSVELSTPEVEKSTLGAGARRWPST
jgi:hypothetical protein